MYAIMVSGAKQYKVAAGDVICVEKLEADVDDEVEFETLLVCDKNKVKIGTPTVKGVKVKCKVIKHGKSRKIIVFKHKAKKGYKKKQGHRQPFTKLEVLEIGKKSKKSEEEEAKA